MKRWILALIGAAALVGAAAPLALADPQGHGRGGEGRGGREHGDGGGNRGGGDYRGRGEGRSGERGGDYRGGQFHGAPGSNEHFERRGELRGPGAERWDERRHNGYWRNNHWYYGPPPGAYDGEPGFRPGVEWRRGAILPPYYQSFVVEDYWQFHLRRPPYGYHWVRVGDEFLLVSIGSGLIFDIVSGF
ncbi:MAG: RcnB family protein [Caulobacterales bacterium]